jgi:hypothetical protein
VNIPGSTRSSVTVLCVMAFCAANCRPTPRFGSSIPAVAQEQCSSKHGEHRHRDSSKAKQQQRQQVVGSADGHSSAPPLLGRHRRW